MVDLARAGDAGQQDHPLIEFAQLFHDRRQIELGEVGNEVVHAPGDHAHVPLLLQEIDAESPVLAVDFDGVGEVDAAGFVEDLPPCARRASAGRAAPSRRRRSARDSSAAASRCTRTIRRPAHLQVQVAPFQLHQRAKELVDFQIRPSWRERCSIAGIARLRRRLTVRMFLTHAIVLDTGSDATSQLASAASCRIPR